MTEDQLIQEEQSVRDDEQEEQSVQGDTQEEQPLQEEQSAQEEQPLQEDQTMQQEQNSQAEKELPQTPFTGKKLSIMGDSLSTFDGWIPEGYSIFYPYNGEVSSAEETWWRMLLSDTGMVLCSNASSSGSTCVGDSTGIDDPKYGCSGYRIQGLTGEYGEHPDIILVYMGTNDLLVGTPLGDNDGTKNVEEGMIENFSDAYCLILDKLASAYPAAQIFCCGLAQVGNWGTDQPFVTYENSLGLTAVDYNRCIEQIAETKGCPYINLYDCGIVPENMPGKVSDGVHFTPEGMKLIKESIEAGLYDYFPAS